MLILANMILNQLKIVTEIWALHFLDISLQRS